MARSSRIVAIPRRRRWVAAGLLLALGLAGGRGEAAATTTRSGSQAPPRPTGPGSRWVPTPSDRWLYQLGDPVPDVGNCQVPAAGGRCVKPTVWVLDLYAQNGSSPNAAGARAVHRAGGRAVCYVSAGTWERWRPDAAAFADALRGRALEAWPGERWLDIRATEALGPVMAARARSCQRAGFDAIDWDNVDGYTNDTGFRLTPSDQLAYNRMLARITHDLGLSAGLKNDLDQVRELLPDFDFAVTEECAQYRECDALTPFSHAGKAVVQIEYALAAPSFCRAANARGWSAMAMNRRLSPRPWTPCR